MIHAATSVPPSRPRRPDRLSFPHRRLERRYDNISIDFDQIDISRRQEELAQDIWMSENVLYLSAIVIGAIQFIGLSFSICRLSNWMIGVKVTLSLNRRPARASYIVPSSSSGGHVDRRAVNGIFRLHHLPMHDSGQRHLQSARLLPAACNRPVSLRGHVHHHIRHLANQHQWIWVPLSRLSDTWSLCPDRASECPSSGLGGIRCE